MRENMDKSWNILLDDMPWDKLLDDDLHSHSSEKLINFVLSKLVKLKKSIQKTNLKDPKTAAEFYDFAVAAEKWLERTDMSKKSELYLEVSNLVLLARITNKLSGLASRFKGGKGKIDCFGFRRKAKSEYDEDLIDDFLDEVLASGDVNLSTRYSYDEWEELLLSHVE